MAEKLKYVVGIGKMEYKLNFEGANVVPSHTIFTNENLKRFHEEVRTSLLEYNEEIRIMKIKNYELALTRVIG